MDLYRVGVPSIGETWPRRFNVDRASGGLGTGVYAFRDREAAEDNISNSSPDSELIVLRDALESPIQPRKYDATTALVTLSQIMDLLYRRNKTGEYTYDDARNAGERLKVNLITFGSGEKEFGTGSRVASKAFKVLINTPELQSTYGLDDEAFVADLIDATEEADRDIESGRPETNVQPINKLLYPKYDGVAPLSDAGGNSGRDGCVVFKERVDRIVGEETGYNEQIPAEVLNAGF